MWVTTFQPLPRGSCSGLWQAAEPVSMRPAVLQSSCFISSDYVEALAPALMPIFQPHRNQTRPLNTEGEAQYCSYCCFKSPSPHLLEIVVLRDTPNSWAVLSYPVLKAALCVRCISCGASWQDKELATRPNGPHPNQSLTSGLESSPFKVFSCITVCQED